MSYFESATSYANPEQTTVQPLQAREVLPEQHVHQVAPQIEREFRHGDLEQERARVEADLGQFRDTRTVEGTSRSTGVASQALGEHCKKLTYMSNSC